ncbi:MAG: hypothetical protein R3C49_00860 [Planctomycetaceae bacterium]
MAITKQFPGLTLRVYRGKWIDDVSFNGNYGFPDDASGIAITLDTGQEVDVGSPKTMLWIYSALKS